MPDDLMRLGCFAFGDERWPGLAKLVEECGEVVQVIGKLMMTHGDPAHWSGDLRLALIEELGDLKAAIEFVEVHNFDATARIDMATRQNDKMVKFLGWHDDFDADPYPGRAAALRAKEQDDVATD